MNSILDYMGGEPTPEPTIEPVKPKGLNPFDFVEDVTVNKRDIIRNSDNPEYMESGYNPWITNKTLSYFEDTIIYANEMNKYSFLSNQMQFDYFLKSINKRKRFSKQFKKVVTNDVTAVATYFGYSIRRAEQAIKFLTVNQIEEIKAKTNPGGVS